MVMSRYQNARENHDVKVAIKFFVNVIQFKYLRMIVASIDYIHIPGMLADIQFRIFSLSVSCLKT
jgi:hypothetical protein